MLKKSLKYLIIVTINLVVLTGFLWLWTDNLELLINPGVLPLELLKIIAINILSLTGIRILIAYFRKRNITATKTKLRAAILLTVLFSSYLYIGYSWKIVDNRILNSQLRREIAAKIKPAIGVLPGGTRLEGLTINEYREISKIRRFTVLPVEADNINYSYGEEGFLPDYLFELRYDLPAEMKIDTFTDQKGKFLRYQKFEVIGNKKRVVYSEGIQ